MALTRLFNDKTGRYTQQGADLTREAERQIIEAYKSVVRQGVCPRDAFVSLNGSLFEAMCDAVLDNDEKQKEP